MLRVSQEGQGFRLTSDPAQPSCPKLTAQRSLSLKSCVIQPKAGALRLSLSSRSQ